MLVLSRKEGEKVVIPDCGVTFTVLAIHGKNVRLGVSAPPEIAVHRKEIADRVGGSGHGKPAMAEASPDPTVPVRVLIADPDDYLVDCYRQYLELHGFEVLVASNGLDCVDRLRDSAPDVLVLEPALPWGWGDGVLAMMCEEPDVALVPVIVLTSGRDRGILYRLSPFQIDDYQVKPLSGKRLAERIRALARLPHFGAV